MNITGRVARVLGCPFQVRLNCSTSRKHCQIVSNKKSYIIRKEKVVPLEEKSQKMTGSVRESVARGGIDAVFKIFSPQQSSTYLPITNIKYHPQNK